MTNPNEINLQSYHRLFRVQREYVVEAFCANTIALKKRYCDHCFNLPLKWKHLAVADGIVEITCDRNRQAGVFLIWRGILNSWQGVMYQSDDIFPSDPSIVDANKITKIEKNWYYIDHSQKKSPRHIPVP